MCLVEWRYRCGQAPERTGKMGMDASNIYIVVNERHSYHGNGNASMLRSPKTNFVNLLKICRKIVL